MHIVNMVGKRYARLVGVSDAGPGKWGRKWLFACDCGKTTTTSGGLVRRGFVKSCGCAQNRTHLCTKSPVFDVWRGMMRRCDVPTEIGYKNYGGRGISVCERWRDVKLFIADMQPTYRPGLSIDRINNDGNYEPSNCRWTDMKTQRRNTRFNLWATILGVTKCASEWAEIAGLPRQRTSHRIRDGWDPILALVVPKLPTGIWRPREAIIEYS